MIRRLIPATAVLALTAACGTGGGAVAVQPPSNPDSIVVSGGGSAPAPVVSSTAVTSGGHSGGRTAPLPQPGASEQLWLIRGAKLWPTTRTQPRRPSAPVFLLRALGNGPTASERTAGLSSAVAPATVLGVRITRGVAIVHLNPGLGGTAASRQLERAQIVFTLTGLRAVHSVQLAVAGQDISPPLTRLKLRDALPAVVITSPTAGGVVTPRTTIAGITRYPAADVQIRLLDAAGNPLMSGDSSSGCSRACLGSFSLPIDQLETPRAGPGTLEVVVHPAGGGLPITLREPVLLRPTFNVVSPAEGDTLTSPATILFYSGLRDAGPVRVALYDSSFHLLAEQVVRPHIPPCSPTVQCQVVGPALAHLAFRVAGVQPGYLVVTPLPGSGGGQQDILEIPVTLNGG